MAGLISGGQTVAVALQEAQDADRVTTGTVLATRAGNWGLGVFLQTSDNRCALLQRIVQQGSPGFWCYTCTSTTGLTDLYLLSR